ncbi:transcription factor YY2 [Tenrec ecaudatus]|uniref:transcription factor YY2 n=1 Tax=Tenrec ecaudatus TaxID=94439 RepID=UPI003F5A8FB1
MATVPVETFQYGDLGGSWVHGGHDQSPPIVLQPVFPDTLMQEGEAEDFVAVQPREEVVGDSDTSRDLEDLLGPAGASQDECFQQLLAAFSASASLSGSPSKPFYPSDAYPSCSEAGPGPSRASGAAAGLSHSGTEPGTKKWVPRLVQIKTLEGEFSVTMWTSSANRGHEVGGPAETGTVAAAALAAEAGATETAEGKAEAEAEAAEGKVEAAEMTEPAEGIVEAEMAEAAEREAEAAEMAAAAEGKAEAAVAEAEAPEPMEAATTEERSGRVSPPDFSEYLTGKKFPPGGIPGVDLTDRKQLAEFTKMKRKKPKDDSTRTIPCLHAGCDKKFHDNSALRKHLHVHGPRVHVCPECGKHFLESSKLKRHQLVHTGEKPYHCVFEGCGKCFSLDFNLRTHVRIHTGDRPFVCPFAGCSKTFTQSTNLKSHVLTHAKKAK